MTEKEYASLVKKLSPPSPAGKHCLWAFTVGGLICCLGQLLITLCESSGLSKEDAGLSASLTLIALSALLTGLSLYDNLAKHAGAGTLVPITGFANAISSTAIEFQVEGWLTAGGAASKMFSIAGPVIVYGTAASVVYGFLYWLSARF